jgi:hypothetical protein
MELQCAILKPVATSYQSTHRFSGTGFAWTFSWVMVGTKQMLRNGSLQTRTPLLRMSIAPPVVVLLICFPTETVPAGLAWTKHLRAARQRRLALITFLTNKWQPAVLTLVVDMNHVQPKDGVRTPLEIAIVNSFLNVWVTSC